MQEVGAEGDGSAHAMKGMGENFGKSQTEECEVARRVFGCSSQFGLETGFLDSQEY